MPYVFHREVGRQKVKVYYTNVWDPHLKRKIKRKVGTSKREAEDVAERLRAKILARGLGIRPRAQAPLLDEFVPRFLSDNYAGRVSVRSAERATERFREFAGNIPLTAVTKGLLHEFVSWRRKHQVPSPYRGKSKASPRAKTWAPQRPIKNGTINRDVQTLKRMISFAHEHEVIEWNTLSGFKTLPTKDSIRKPLLAPEQVQRLLIEAGKSKDRRFQAALVLALYTARRRSDLLRRQTKDYDRSQSLLFLGKTKKGEAEWIQLAGAARRALDLLFDNAVNGWLLPNADGTGPIKDMDTAFREAKKRAGIDPQFRWHDMRHVGISYMVMAGVDFSTIASLVGHTTPTMIEQRYGHLSQRHKDATARVFGGYMDRITGVAPASVMAASMQEPSVSAQVADLISAEAAQAIGVGKVLCLPPSYRDVGAAPDTVPAKSDTIPSLRP